MAEPQYDPQALKRHAGAMARLRDYMTSGRYSVRGWFQDGAASVIWSLLEAQKVYNLGGDVAEIGVYHGKLFIALALSATDQEKAVALDPFEMRDQSFLSAFAANVERFGVSDRCRALRGFSSALTEDAARSMFGAANRFVSVDGSHEYADVLHDLRLAEAISCDYGIIAVDDYFSVANPGVTEAAIDYLRGGAGMTPFAISAADGAVRSGASKLYLCRPQYAKFYLSLLALLNRANLCSYVEVCKTPVALFEFAQPPTRVALFR